MAQVVQCLSSKRKAPIEEEIGPGYLKKQEKELLMHNVGRENV
jgi:hypothetical protein